MSYPPLPSNGQTNWGDNFRAWADALEGRKVEGESMSLRYSTTIGTRVFLDHPGGSTMLYGDTGWRGLPIPTDIPGAIPYGGAPLQIRRVGNVVNLLIDRVTINSEYISASLQIYVGPGFSPRGIYLPNAGYPETARRGWLWSGYNLIAYGGSGTFDSRWNWTWITTAPWPATLPGIPT